MSKQKVATESADNQSQEVVEEINIKVTRNAPQVERRSYTVLSPAGLFKNGVQYDEGSTIELDPATADRFMDLGEITNA